MIGLRIVCDTYIASCIVIQVHRKYCQKDLTTTKKTEIKHQDEEKITTYFGSWFRQGVS